MWLIKHIQLRNQANKYEKGLTLIEIVIVIAIISITMAMTTISFGNPQQKQIEQHSARMSALIQLAREQAIFNGQDYALGVTTSGYGFYQLTESGWQIIDDDTLFRSRQLNQDLNFKLYLDGIRVKLYYEFEGPQIFINSDGEVTPFQINITNNNDLSYQLAYKHATSFVISQDERI